jgi:hypothetical protein
MTFAKPSHHRAIRIGPNDVRRPAIDQTGGAQAIFALGVDFAPPGVGQTLAQTRPGYLLAEFQLETIGGFADPGFYRRFASFQLIGQETF